MQTIFFVGMPGAGKSYWAARLAAATGLQCIDLDDIITIRTGMPIPDFFDRHGEAAFRRLEQQTLGQVLEVFPANVVVACGGGTPCYFDNMARMKAAGLVVYLDAPVALLTERNNAEPGSRPLLRHSLLASRLAQLQGERAEHYAQAHIRLDAGNLEEAGLLQALRQYLS